MKKIVSRTLCVLLASCAALSWAGEIGKAADKATVWQAGVDGVEIEWGPTGEFNRIYSAFYQPVSIADRRGISKAQIIAEEKAKAAVIRFMDQNVSSRRVIEQVDTDMEKATRTQGKGTAENWTKENQRKMVETLTEVTTSYSSGHLRGVIVLEKGYDEARGEAWVKVGISKKTMGAAGALQSATQAPPAGDDPAHPVVSGSTLNQPSEVRRSQQRDW